MRLVKNIYLPVTVIAAASLVLVCFAEWRYFGTGRIWRLATSAGCIVGAVGVIWLGWYWLRLTEEVTSIAKRLKGDETGRTTAEGCITDELNEVINNRLANSADYERALEKQIKDLQIQLQLSQKQKRSTDAIIYSIRDAVIVIDEFDRLLMANEAAGKIFDFDFKDLRHKHISEVIASEKKDFVEFLCQSRLSKARHTRREMEFLLDEKLRVFDCIISCVYEQKGSGNILQKGVKEEMEQFCGVVAVLHDITREKEISRMKDDFVSHVSHELKTPLAAITAYSEMLLDGEANNEQTRKEFYSVIQNQAQRLNRLIEDILNTSRIESGLIKIHKEPVSLTVLIEEQLGMMRGYADEKNIALSWGNAGQKPIVFDQVYADKDMISQVIINLLSNAVKYTASGGSIRIKTEVDEIESLARVSVTDTGVGIPESEIEHVFDKFYRVDAHKTRAEGTGLGLNLVKQIVEKIHNGRVFVRSQLGKGSTFGFELPLAMAGAAAF